MSESEDPQNILIGAQSVSHYLQSTGTLLEAPSVELEGIETLLEPLSVKNEGPRFLQAASVIDLQNTVYDERKSMFSKTEKTSYKVKKCRNIFMNVF